MAGDRVKMLCFQPFCFYGEACINLLSIPMNKYAALDQILRLFIHHIKGFGNLVKSFIFVIEHLAGIYTSCCQYYYAFF